MPIVNIPIYRQLFDFLCLASIAISVAEASGGIYQHGRTVPPLAATSRMRAECLWLTHERAKAAGGMGAASALTTG